MTITLLNYSIFNKHFNCSQEPPISRAEDTINLLTIKNDNTWIISSQFRQNCQAINLNSSTEITDAYISQDKVEGWWGVYEN